MSLRTVVMLHTVAGGLLLGTVAASTSPLLSRSSLTGVVTDAQTGHPIWSSGVRIVGSQVGARTNRDGEFLIVALPVTDTITLNFSHPCYYDVRVTVPSDNKPRILTVGLPAGAPPSNKLDPCFSRSRGER